MRFLNNFFLSQELKICLLILEEYKIEFENEILSSDNSICEGAALLDVCRKTKETLKKNSKLITESINLGKTTSRLIVVRTIFTICKSEVSSGQNHVYRGVLSSLGKGYYFILKKSLKILLALNDLDRETFKDVKSELKDNIQNVG